MANTEDIEAKLCAYIDGELDAAGRAEIEKHLETNPRHRQLIEELTRSRNLLRELPSESAPPDIAEALHSQLERSVLLGDMDEPKESVVLRISRWPQFAAVAAIIVLAVGLGAVVYFVLPPSAPTPEYAITEPALPDGDALTTLPAADEPKMLSGERDIAAFTREAKVAETETPTPAVVAPSASMDNAFAPPPPTDTAVARADKDAGAEQEHGPMFKTGDLQKNIGNKSLLVVVKTNDSRQADQDVTSYLTSNNLAWQNATEPMPQPLNIGESQVMSASRLNQTRVQMKQSEPAMSKAGQVHAPAAGEVSERSLGDRDADVVQKQNLAQDQPARSHAQVGDATPTTAPMQVIAEQPRDTMENLQQQLTQAQQQPTQGQPQSTQELQRETLASDAETQQLVQAQLDNLKAIEPAGNYTIDNAYVVRNVTREEAEKLSQQLSQQRLGQRALIVEDVQKGQKDFAAGPLDANATTQPATQPTQAAAPPAGPEESRARMEQANLPAVVEPAPLLSGDVFTCQIDGLQGAAAREQTLQIAEDGTVFLPVVGNIRAAGLTADQLQSVISNEYARALLINQPSVKIDRVDDGQQEQAAAAPATHPIEQVQMAQPENAADAAIPQATEPGQGGAGLGGAPAAERVNVIIVVQNELPLLPETNLSTTQPATMPASDSLPSATQPALP